MACLMKLSLKSNERTYFDNNHLQECARWYKLITLFNAKLVELFPEQQDFIESLKSKSRDTALGSSDYLSIEMTALESYLNQTWPLTKIEKVMRFAFHKTDDKLMNVCKFLEESLLSFFKNRYSEGI
jgi:hypothetical protein